MAASHADMKGAFGLELEDGKEGREMIDAPMLKQVREMFCDVFPGCFDKFCVQAQNTIRIAKAAGLHIPEV